MSAKRSERGASLIELMISLVIFLLAMSGLATFLLQNARINKAQQMTADVQANARNTLSVVVQKMRSAGWDPLQFGMDALTLDPDLADDVSEIEVFADLNADGDSDDTDEQILIRHTGTGKTVEWRPDNDVSTPFVTLSTNISNDADGDGTIEPMFVPDDTTNPTVITIRITAQSPAPDPTSGQFIRYTVMSDVALRREV
jgi:type II secretory pathway pseudopilin PulG